ncbi:MAG: DUF3298 and DUF4163 domain-containing protein [Tannerella sp.]|jgi:hypothetical protein|nr:DUF3298 and DUF4163 domain-containing protein [Tannerella sp.]
MKSNLFVLVPILAFIGLCTFGCHPKAPAIANNNIRFDSIDIEKTYYLMGKQENPHCDLRLKYVYPVGGLKPELLKAVQKEFIRAFFGDDSQAVSVPVAAQRYAEQYIEDYKALEPDFKKEKEAQHEASDAPLAWYSYYENISNEVTYDAGNLLSFAIDFENYTGGAHGSQSYTAFNIDLRTGNQITEADLYNDGYDTELAKLLVAKLVQNNKVGNPKELESIGYFSVDEIYPNNNFSIDSTGITYHFNEYEIAAYAVGRSDVHLSFEEIKPLLKEDNPIAALVGK